MNRRGFRQEFHQIAVVGIVIIVMGHHSARTDISLFFSNVNICVYISFLVVNVKTRGGTPS